MTQLSDISFKAYAKKPYIKEANSEYMGLQNIRYGEKCLIETSKLYSHFVTNGYEYVISAEITNPIILPQEFTPHAGLIRRRKTNEKDTYKSEPHFLALMTLFFSETAKQLEQFYNYYRHQGVSKFYMFYNGKLEDVKNLPTANDIEYIEWNFPYCVWETLKNDARLISYAQPSAINTFYYKFSHNIDYCILCDVDEFMYYKKGKLIDYLKCTSPGHIYVRHCWARIDFKSLLFFYNKTLSFDSNPKWRAKCIHPGLKSHEQNPVPINVHTSSHNESLCEDIIMLHIKKHNICYPDYEKIIF